MGSVWVIVQKEAIEGVRAVITDTEIYDVKRPITFVAKLEPTALRTEEGHADEWRGYSAEEGIFVSGYSFKEGVFPKRWTAIFRPTQTELDEWKRRFDE